MNLVRALAAEGLKPVALVPPGDGEAELRQAGVPVHTIAMSADDTSPLSGFMLFVRYIRALRRIRPAAFLGFTPKPNIFGSMAASALKIPVINNVTGLGTAFIHGGVLGTLVPNLYRIALRRSHRVFFHNEEDRELFIKKGLASPGRAAVIPGSGVDLQRFTATPLPGESGNLTLLFIGRLLEDSLASFVKNYVQAEYSSQGALIRVAMNLVPAALVLAAGRRLAFSDTERRLWRNFAIASFALLALVVFSPSTTAVDRVALYVLPAQIAVLSRVPGGLMRELTGKLAVVAYSFAVQFVWLNFAANAESWVPYKFFPLT